MSRPTNSLRSLPPRGAVSGFGRPGATDLRSRAAAVLAALLLTACMLGPDYQRPPVDTPAGYQYAPKDAAATADLDWWKQFGDPVLDQLIAEALANNRNVMIAAANVEQAAGIVTTTRAPMFPQVGYQGAATRIRFSQQGTSALPSELTNPTNAYQLLGGASWEIDLWGRIRRQTESARANLMATEEARRGVILSLVASVAAEYITLRALDEQLTMAVRTQASYGESLRLMELQFKYGRVSEMNVAQAQSRYDTATAEIPRIRREIAQRQDALSVLLGRNPGPIPRGKTILELVPPQVPAGVPSQLLERRPDLLQAEQQLVAANAQIGAAKALYFPTISLTGALGTASTQLGNLFSGPAQTWNFAGSIVGPIFTAGSISGQVAQAEAAQKAALLSYRQAIQNAFADVDTALAARAELGDQVLAQDRLVKSLERYRRLARLQYDGGRAPYSTVLQAEEQLFPAELNYAVARGQLLTSAVNIYKAMGGGWVDKADAMTGASASGAAAAP
ncbi:MAG: efflux transporter outer membrane subunit [Burkholderiales bacterium]